MEQLQPAQREYVEAFGPTLENNTPYNGPIRPMRGNQTSTNNATSYRKATVPSVAAIALNRLAYGPRPGGIAAFNQLGATDASRLAAYVEAQLNPETINNSTFESKLNSLQLTTLAKSLTTLWSDHAYGADWTVVTQPVQEVMYAKFVRATESEAQLLEIISDFWHDHFHIYGWDWPAVSVMPEYDRIIRANAFGNFRIFLEQIATSTAMLFYLDNVYSDVEGPNENYARELLELHTLGADAYFGTLAASQVPGYPSAPEGFVDADVEAVARCLTGWSVRYQSWIAEIGSTGEFIYHDAWHDGGAKTVMGQAIPAGQPAQKDGRDVFDILARHPATATHICTKLCQKLISDEPPMALVASAAALFRQAVDAPDQLKQVIRHIVVSAEFRSTFASKIKRPFHAAIAAQRATQSTFIMTENSDETGRFLWFFSLLGQYPFSWHPPNGYPDVQPPWAATSTLLMRWRMLSWLPTWVNPQTGKFYADIMAQTPITLVTPNALVDFWIDRIFGYTIEPATRTIFIEFMAQGRNPAYPLPIQTSESLQHRLRALVGIMLMSPEFQQR